MMVFVMTACSKAPPATASQPVATVSATVPAAAVIDLRPVTISFQGHTIARLFADGRTESAGPNAPGTDLVSGPTLHADGTIVLTKAGVTARLDKTGNLYVAGPAGANAREQLFGRISHDQFTFSGSDRPWNVRVRGNLIEFGEHNSSQIDGDVTPAMRHTALVMAAAFYIEGALTAP
jgi:hypothetical protein